MLRLVAFWLGVSVPLALLAGRVIHLTTPDLVAEIEDYLRHRRRRSLRRAATVVIGFIGIGAAVAASTPAGDRLPSVTAVTDWAFDVQRDAAPPTTDAPRGVRRATDQPASAGRPAEPARGAVPANESTAGEAGATAAPVLGATDDPDDASIEDEAIAPAEDERDRVDEIAAPAYGGPGGGGGSPDDDEERTTAPVIADPEPGPEPEPEPEPPTTTTTTPPGETTTTTTAPTETTTTTTAPPEDEPTTDTGTTTTTTTPAPTEPAEGGN